MRHKKKITIVSVLILIVGIFSYMLFSKNGYKEYTSRESFANLVDILLDSTNGKEKIDINEESINSIASSYLQQGIKKGKITIKGFNANISKDKIKFLIPVKYKSLPLMLSSEGRVELNNDKIIYTSEYFKVGKLPIPKEKVISYIKKMNNSKLKIEDDKFIINSSLLGGKVQIVDIQDGKFTGKIKDNGKKLVSRVDKAIKKFESKDMEQKIEQKIEEKINSKDSKSIESKMNGKIQNEKLNSTTNKNTGIAKGSSSKGSSLGSKEMQMISIMNSTISKLDSNISYNYWPDVERVMGIYDTLPSAEKSKFKNQVFNYVDVVKAKDIKHRLGK
ncbi:hypothetical protein [Clostridium botulinum]|uniref:Uncharacterized protein n=1 Tax=Clostridium botulinum TaxID=1491 RepID=A0A9Q1UZ22_CLOBO|nr:hypothetical protein [Clostridium botulinum]AEB75400.1 hypothetical protein CbC4_0720 [Clostridium botulinum BKT015925]KEH99917.1 hypothetical protein Z953_10705 [Clostridium botulinum D str. 16868]KEI03763.1 hypothetical protein Y848_04375 [Clostridium botulinum C/D str. Sp77]KLU76364.1 hypothetical protein CBC3_03950 [Clostridium botulinum V891]KOA73632.1 hypothetical protein ADU78_11970 [Clostridium botulinum]